MEAAATEIRSLFSSSYSLGFRDRERGRKEWKRRGGGRSGGEGWDDRGEEREGWKRRARGEWVKGRVEE